MVPANSCRIPRVPHYSGVKLEVENFHIHDYHVLWCAFPNTFVNLLLPLCLIPRPRLSMLNRFRLFRVRSPLLTKSLLFSFPRGTEMVHFPRFASSNLCIQLEIAGHDSSGVAPFGNPRINACLPLPEAYRCLPRPSSPLCAKASTVNP